ncbi:MAG: preprotein translocase subunit YajC [Bacteroidales bacterium]|nr:preprotein translocase subunit YajC [Bacteroidales bacterium]MBQ9529058.1 preprotein translocase subunit YajC [Bacteroidales bacterium]
MKFLTFILQADAAAPKAGGSWSFLIMILLMFLVMWLFMIRPQQKKQKEMDKFRKELQKGDKVVTIGGIYGTVNEIRDATVDIKVAEGVNIRVDKASLVKDFSDSQQA